MFGKPFKDIAGARIVLWKNNFLRRSPHYKRFFNATILPTAKFETKEKTFDGAVYDNTGLLYFNALHRKNGYRNKIAAKLPASVQTEKLGGKYVYGGFLQNTHFGHFLVESLSRLWAVSALSRIDGVVFVLRDIKKPPASFVLTILSKLLPDKKVVVVTTPTKVEELVIPDQLSHPRSGYIQGHLRNKFLLQSLRIEDSSSAKKVYVSRSRLKSNEGLFLGERVLEENLKREGYVTIHPQELTIEEQLRVYTNAEKLVFADGSAFHLYILVANAEQDSFIVWRRKSHEDFLQQSLSFLNKKPSGVACLKGFYKETGKKHSSGTHKAVLDFDTLKQQLCDTSFIKGTHWISTNNDEVEQQIAHISKRLKRQYEFIETRLDGTRPSPARTDQTN